MDYCFMSKTYLKKFLPLKISMDSLRTRSLKIVLSKIDWVILIAAILMGVMLGFLSIIRYTGYNAFMFDLGNMSQAIWSGTKGHPLEFTYDDIGNISRLSIHVELFYWLLVPLYSLFPSPITLLVFQTLLFVAGAYPVYKLSNRKLHSRTAARLITLIYLFYPVAQTAVLFDFHGDTLAMPLLLFAIESLDRRAWKSYYIWLALGLSCKFYVAFPVALLGIILWLQGQHRDGLITFLLATGWGVIAYFIIRPMFSASNITEVGFMSVIGYFQFYFGSLLRDLPSSIILRIFMALIIFLPAILIARRAFLWSLPGVGVGLVALLNAYGGSYDYRTHHYALVVPFLIGAIIFGTEKIQYNQFKKTINKKKNTLFNWIVPVKFTLLTTIILNILLVDTPINPRFLSIPPLFALNGTKFDNPLRDRFKDQWLVNNIPGYSSIAASAPLMAHLTNREYIYSVDYLSELLNKIDYAIPDALMDHNYHLRQKPHEGVLYDAKAINTLLNSNDFGLVASQDGLLLFQKNPPIDKVLLQRVEVYQTVQTPTVIANFNQTIGLTQFKISLLGGRRFRFQYDWILISPLEISKPLFAITRLEGINNGRIVHLPTEVMRPTETWKMGQVIREVFDVQLSQDIPSGQYTMWIGWYDSGNIYAYYTDARSRVGEEYQVGSITLP
jgi:uncharacterized membrane protein